MREQYRIPLEGCSNFRDLGGHSIKNGGVTKTGRLFRSDSLSKLTNNDIAAISTLGITAVLDLRFPYEAAESANRLQNHAGFLYENISVADKAQANPLDFPDTNEEFYNNILHKGKEQVAAVFRFLIENADKNIVFHCTAGKDRTGVVAALLLDLVGVARADIMADYAQTHAYKWDELMELKKTIEAQRGITLKDSMFASLPESMEAFLDELYRVYGGAAAYLTVIGFSERDLCTLRKMLGS